MENVLRVSTDSAGIFGKPGPSTLYDGSVTITETTSRMEQLNFVNKWKVEQFSVQQELCPPGEFIEGSVFGSGPYRFQMRLFPSGKDDECSGFISLYLLIRECPGSRVSFRVNFSLETLDGPRGCALNKNVVTINKGGIVTASKFFAIETLKTRGSRFLPDDSLVLNVEMTVYGEVKHNKNELDGSDLEDDSNDLIRPSLSRESSLFSIDRKRKSVAGELSLLGKPIPDDDYEGGYGALFTSGVLSDFVIVCGTHEIKTHRAVLYARSGYFQGIFRSGLSETSTGRVTIDDIEPDVLEACINYMYTLNCPQLLTIPSRIARAADRLLMNGLKQRCESILSVDLYPTNVPERLRVSYQLNMPKLNKKCIGYFSRNREDICVTEEWKDLRRDDPDLASRIMEDAWKVAEKMRYPSYKRRRPSEDIGVFPEDKRFRSSTDL